MALQTGTRLGPYEILAPLGAGGMGEVYRARDTKLGREVAIKVLPEDFAEDAERLLRFEREAKVLASLNHPNIATLYGFESEGETHYLVMELVEGETLAERIVRGAIAVDEALPLFVQIAQGLEAAHQKGVIHRDLKPANIKVTEEGRVKILDFGLAKAMGPEAAAGSDPSQPPTLTTGATRRGEILGTPAYMSPEQAKGKVVDKRTDIWAFGCVLFEALTGQRAFQAEDAPDTLAKVLRAKLDWDYLPPTTPQPIRTLLRRCLEREPTERLRDIGDAVLELDDAVSAPMPSKVSASRGMRLSLVAALAVACLLAWVAIDGVVFRSRSVGPEADALSVRSVLSAPPSPPAQWGGYTIDIAITPDGECAVYTTRVDGEGLRLYSRPIDRLEGSLLTGRNVVGPFVSPDSRWVGYYDMWAEELKRTPIDGGPALTICKSGYPRGASWGGDGTVVFATDANEGLYRVPAIGGEVEVLTVPNRQAGEIAHLYPQVLPGGDTVLFTIGGAQGFEIALLSLATREWRSLSREGSAARYAPSGHLVYAHNGDLWAVAFDVEDQRIAGDPVMVLDGLVTKFSAASFDLSDGGSLVYISEDSELTSARSLVWVDREGFEEPLGVELRGYQTPRVSPSGDRIAFFDRTRDSGGLWILDLSRGGTFSRLIQGWQDGLVWTADGERLISGTRGAGKDSTLYSVPADGSSPPEPLLEDLGVLFPTSLSADGARLLYHHVVDFRWQSRGDIGVLSLDSERQALPLLDSESNEGSAELSPNGRWLAYKSNESGRDEVYVRPFPAVDDRKWPISSNGGAEPLWSPDGSELFYRSGNRLMAVSTQTEGEFRPETPEVLFEGEYYIYFFHMTREYDISPDGKRFLMIKKTTSANQGDVVLIQNWFEELKRLVPTDN